MAQFLTPYKLKNMTVGEKRFVALLEKYLNDEYLVWFDLPVQGKQRRYPDFLIFHPGCGLLCIEIKDWRMRHLCAVNAESVTLNIDGTQVNKQHPLEQARSAFLPLIQKMQKDPKLLQNAGKHKGKLALPWGIGAVMSNWEYKKVSRQAQSLLENTFPRSQTFYKEDILENALTEAEFLQKLHAIFPYRFETRLTDEQVTRIRAHIFPEFIIRQNLLNPEAAPSEAQFSDSLRVMDNAQELLARRMGDGHRVIHGVAGSGKTVFLEYRARRLAEENPAKPILVLCFNKPLAACLQQRLRQPNITVHHFYDWCKTLKQRHHIDIPYGKDYLERLPHEIYRAMEDGRIPTGQYHAVLIDEGHDFAAEWLKAAACQPDPEHEHLLLIYDDTQSIYDNRSGLNFTLSSVGIKARGRTDILRINYRNSSEILHYAARFIARFLEAHDCDDDEIPIIAPECGGKDTGISPVFSQFHHAREETDNILSTIARWQQQGCAPGDIAVLCYFKSQGEALKDQLAVQGIDVQDLTQENLREQYAPDPQRPTLCTIHSSKGLEFPRVIICGIGHLKDDAQYLLKSARLLYVGMTRAQTHLYLTASKENHFTALLAD